MGKEATKQAESAAPAITLEDQTFQEGASSGLPNIIVIAGQSLNILQPNVNVTAVFTSAPGRPSFAPITHVLEVLQVTGSETFVRIDTSTQKIQELPLTAKASTSNSPSDSGLQASATSPVTTSSSTTPSISSSSTTVAGANMGTGTPRPTATTGSSSGSSITNATSQGQSSPSSSSKSASSSSSNGLSKGAAAGIGIGCAIAGALIAALLVFFLMRRKRRGRPSRSYPLVEKPATLSQQPNGSMKAAIPASSAFAIAESSLPLPPEDAAVGGEMSKLQTLIKNYAQSYYHTTTVAGKSPDLSALGQLSIPMATLAAMLTDSRTRLVAIRYCVAWTIFSRIGLNSDANMSLLPPEVAGCTRPISADTASKNYIPSLASWRALTHSLLASTYPTSSSAPLNAASLQAAVSALDTVLQPYADKNRDSYERMTKLEEILKRGGKFGWTLFGQISSFDFDWERRTRGEVAIFPALVQVTDEKGERLNARGRVLWEGEGMRVEGL